MPKKTQGDWDVVSTAPSTPQAGGDWDVVSAAPNEDADKPGVLHRAWNRLMAPIYTDANSPQMAKESKALNNAEDFSQTEAGRQAYEAHPIATQAKAFAAGMERDIPNMFSPAFVAASALPVVKSAVSAAVPAVSRALGVVGGLTKAANTVAMGAQGANQVFDAATADDSGNEDPDAKGVTGFLRNHEGRLVQGLSGAGAVAGTVADIKAASPSLTPAGLRESAQTILGAGRSFQRKTAQGYADAVSRTNAENANIQGRNTKAKLNHEDDMKLWQTKALKASEDHTQAVIDTAEKANKMRNAYNDSVAQGQAQTKAAQDQWEAEQQHATDTERIRNQTFRDLEDVQRQHAQSEVLMKPNAEADNNARWNLIRADLGDKAGDVSHSMATFEAQKEGMLPDQVTAIERYQKALVPDAEGEGGDPNAKLRNDIAKGQGAGTYEAASPAVKAVIDNIAQTMPEYVAPTEVGDEAAGPQAKWNRLHNVKTQLEEDVRGASGPIKHAYAEMLKAVRQDEVNLARTHGKGDQLLKAREMHTQYLDTFVDHKSEPATVANQQKNADNAGSNFAPDLVEAQRREMLQKYDPGYAARGKRIQSMQATLNGLDTREQTAAMLVKPRPEDYIQPVEPTYPGRPQQGIPTPPPKYPNIDLTVPDAPAPNMQHEIHAKIADTLENYGKVGVGALRLLVGGVGGARFLGHPSMGTFATDILLGQAGLTVLSSALSRPTVLDWMSRPTDATLSAIHTTSPVDAAKLKMALTGLAAEDVRRGGRMSVNPGIAMWLGPANMQVIQAAALAGGVPQTAAEAKQRVADFLH